MSQEIDVRLTEASLWKRELEVMLTESFDESAYGIDAGRVAFATGPGYETRFPTSGWVGWCPAPMAMIWESPLSPLLIFAVFAHTDHV